MRDSYSVRAIIVLILFSFLICCQISCQRSDAEQTRNHENRDEGEIALGETVGPGSTLVRPGDPLLPDGSGSPNDSDALLKIWSRGNFDGLEGVELLAKVREHMDVKLLTSIEPVMHEKLCLKVVHFLVAYSSADFDAYLRFRGPGNLVGDDDERVQKRLAAARENWPTNLGPAPATGLELLRSMWDMYIKPDAPPISAVNWSSCRATIAALPQGELVKEEWSPDGGGAESHFYQMFKASRRAAHSQMIMRTPVPNAYKIKILLLDDGRLI